MIRCNAVHVDRLLSDSSKEVSTSDDDSDLATECMYSCNLFGYFVNEDRIDTEAPACRQRFS